jgi:two-component system vancomycin resistance associated response regulator VraR
MPYQVLIVEDQAMPRRLFEIFLESSQQYERVDSISNASLAINIVENKKVDLILMDVCTALNESGLDAAEAIKQKYPHVKIIIVTSMPEYSWIERARNIGVDSFWYKDSEKEEIISVMDKTMAGEHVFPDTTPVVQFGDTTNHALTERELDVLKELTTGDSNQEIGDRLGVSAGTVKRHIENILLKTGFHTRTELVSEAGRLGIVIK